MRLPLIFGAAWLCFAAFCVVSTLPGGHPPLGVLLWALAFHLTLSGRSLSAIFGAVGATNISMSLTALALSLVEVMLIGAGIALARKKGRARGLGASLLLTYVAAHLLVAPIGASRAVLAYRLRSGNLTVVTSALDQIHHDAGRHVDILIEELPAIAQDLQAFERALHTVTALKGIAFWTTYLRGAKGQLSRAGFCERVLDSAERGAMLQCKEVGRETISRQFDELTLEVARCYEREVRARRSEIDKLVVLGRSAPWVIDDYRGLILDELTTRAFPDRMGSFGHPSDARDPCYVHDPEKQLLIEGGNHLRGRSREEIAGVLDYWRACPQRRWTLESGLDASCR